MRRSLLLFGAMLCVSLGASAQDRIITFAPPSSPAAAQQPTAYNPYTDTPWQMNFGYQYNRINLTGKPFVTQGFNVSVVRFFFNWVGVEANMGSGFGNTHTTTNPPNLDAKTLFLAGGLHLSHRSGRVEPWVHALEGVERFRFTQASTTFGSNNALAWEAGAGMDFFLNTRTAIRAQADYLGTRFEGSIQRNFQAGAGFVINF